MILDPNKSRPGLDAIRPTLQRFIDGGIPLKVAVERAMLMFGGNLTAFYLYIMRDDFLGYHQDFQRTVDNLIVFYKYTEILPWADLKEKDEKEEKPKD